MKSNFAYTKVRDHGRRRGMAGRMSRERRVERSDNQCSSIVSAAGAWAGGLLVSWPRREKGTSRERGRGTDGGVIERERERESNVRERRRYMQLRGCLHFSGSCMCVAGSRSLTIDRERKGRVKGEKTEKDRERERRGADHRLARRIVQCRRGRP